jgi:hypothetical protein
VFLNITKPIREVKPSNFFPSKHFVHEAHELRFRRKDGKKAKKVKNANTIEIT